MQFFSGILVLAIHALFIVVCYGKVFSSILSYKALIGAKETEFDFDSIEEFQKFLTLFKGKTKDQLRKEKVPDAIIRDQEAILDLESIIVSNQVCSPQQVDQMIAYHIKYLKGKDFLMLAKPITDKFFTKFAVQVAYTCKKNLIKNLDQARDELKDRSKVFDEAKEKVYNENPGIKTNIKLIEEQPDDMSSSNVKPHDETEVVLSEYREALTKLRRPEDILTFDLNSCKHSKNRETKVATDNLQLFFKPALACHQLHRYYAGTVLSIAKLANHGYTAFDADLDNQLTESPVIRDWILTVQVCDPMIHMATIRTDSDMAIVDTCSDKVPAIETLVYDDDIGSFDKDLLKDMIPRSEATRAHAQKLMKSSLKKIAKADLMKQLRRGSNRRSLFSKTLAMFRSQDKEFSTSTTHFAANPKFSIQMTKDMSSLVGTSGLVQAELPEQELNAVLMKIIGGEVVKEAPNLDERDGIDNAVSFFDPLSTITTSLTVLLIMMSFEWIFFLVMTVAARICQHQYFNFDNLLTFPPKTLSWSDADFARFNDKLEQIDEDDFYDYDELNPSEQQQRDLLQKVFGRPPPMLYKD